MTRIISIAIALMLCMLLAISAGCTQQSTAPAQPTPAPTQEATVSATTATDAPQATEVSSTPGPTQSLPGIWSIDVQVQSNGESIDPQIITTFRGGKGQNLIPRLDIRVTRSDGVVETASMTQPLKVGQTVTLAGTRKNTDRAEVWAITPNGEKVKIYDQYIPFRTFN